jgi:hypothetical protein
MKRVLLTYGIISGAIVSSMLLLSMPLYENGTLDFSNGMVVGYATMVIALSLVFFGVRTFRDEYNGGKISFWKAVQVGLYISLIASVMYCITWEVCYHTLASDFMARMSEYYVDEKKAAGATAEELETLRAEMNQFENMYQNPVIRFGYTLFEILPMGLLFTLVSAGLLRRTSPTQR